MAEANTRLYFDPDFNQDSTLTKFKQNSNNYSFINECSNKTMENL